MRATEPRALAAATKPGELCVTPLGLGGAALGNLYAPVSDESAAETVSAAWDAGLRYFDTAPYYGYGLSERRLGRALGSLPRDEYVLSTKVGRLLAPREDGQTRSDQGFIDALPFDPVFDYSYDAIMRSFEQSLERLGLDRIDVLLMHDIGHLTHGNDEHSRTFEIAMKEGYLALDSLRSSDAIGAIGLGVNEWEVCMDAMERGDFDCFLLAGRYTLLEQTAIERFLPACVERSASVIVGGPYNSGILASGRGGDAHYDYGMAPPDVVDRVKAITSVCRSHGVELSAAALQFPLAHPAVATVIPGARSADEVRSNVRHLEAPVPDALWRDLRTQGLIHPQAPTPGGAESTANEEMQR